MDGTGTNSTKHEASIKWQGRNAGVGGSDRMGSTKRIELNPSFRDGFWAEANHSQTSDMLRKPTVAARSAMLHSRAHKH